MKIKKFIAKDFRTAFKKAKEEMGSDAIILHTSHLKKRGILRNILPGKVEITVAIDDTLQVNTDKLRYINNSGLPEKSPENNSSYVEKNAGSDDSEITKELQKMKNLMSDIKTKMYEVEQIKGLSEEAQFCYEILVCNNVDRDIALNIANKVDSRLPGEKHENKDWIKDVCLHTLQEYITESEPIELDKDNNAKLIFFVGPTGVGKTTTIAKLAANKTFLEGKDVALITLDTYRISAAEQLRTFAEIMDISVSVVFTPQEMMDAISQYSDKDIIFVDTAGRSPHNFEQLQELKQFIDIGKPDETILVLSATTDSGDMIQIYDKFAVLNIDKIIFTKLDETNRYGQILNTIYETKKPVAFFTTGQNVPDDIEIPDYYRLARMLLRRDEA